jgi:hypothetical protein
MFHLQGAEGTDADNEFYVENVLEELDAPGEWFYDASTSILHVYWNATGSPGPATAAGLLSVPQLRELVNITGSQAAPVINVTFSGVGFRDTAYTYFRPHGLPSGGDWALPRTGVLFFEGTVGALVQDCTFERVDGTAIFLSGYTRGAVIRRNEFSWLGTNAIALWGFGSGSPVPRMGPDLTTGDQPRATIIEGNIARELGIWQKQSSFVFQAEAGLSIIRHNIVYNGPRAGMNFNEDSIGGSIIEANLVFNQCRESGDHGEQRLMKLSTHHSFLYCARRQAHSIRGAACLTGTMLCRSHSPMAAPARHRSCGTPLRAISLWQTTTPWRR